MWFEHGCNNCEHHVAALVPLPITACKLLLTGIVCDCAHNRASRMCRGVLARRQSKCLHRAMRTLDTICIPAEWRAKNQRSQRTTHRVHQATCVAPPIVQCNAGCPGRASLKSLVFTRFKLRRLLCEALRPPLFADPFSNCSWLLQHHETASQSVWSSSAGHKLKRLRRTGFVLSAQWQEQPTSNFIGNANIGREKKNAIAHTQHVAAPVPCWVPWYSATSPLFPATPLLSLHPMHQALA